MNEIKTIFHVITTTEVGGAEMMLEKFLMNHESASTSVVVSLTTVGLVGRRLQEHGIPVIPLNICSPLGIISGLVRYGRLFQKNRPKHVVAWMYHAIFLATLYSILGGKDSLVWNIRCGLSDYTSWRKARKLVFKMCSALSGRADHIIFNSIRSRDQHIGHGFRQNKCKVIYNGFESVTLSGEKYVLLRKQLGIKSEVFLIGCFGRNSPIKRMADLLQTCVILRERECPAEILYVGRNFETADFKKKIIQSNLGAHVHLVSEVPSLIPFYSIIDAFALCSQSEGFPNVIGEAVYCHIPVICTDVSDLKNVFLKTWQISPVGDPVSLAASAYRIFRMSEEERENLIKDQLYSFGEKTDLKRVTQALSELL